jgi:hypothetical protein
MRKITILASLVLAFTACGKGGLDAKLDELGKIRDAMCACKDKACADEQHEKYIAWKKGNSKDDKPSDDQMKKFETIRHELMDCRHKLDTPAAPAPEGAGSAPATPPAANP